MKKICLPVIVAFVCLCSYTSCILEDSLYSKGKEYILSHINSPSTAVFISYYDSNSVRTMMREEWNYVLDSNKDVLIIRVEATNGWGGRITESFAVFFRKGVPIHMERADDINGRNVRQIMSIIY